MKNINEYNPFFEVLRVIAIMMLVAYHSSLLLGYTGSGTGSMAKLGLSYAGRMGWIGTDMFLCLAGYLSAESLIKKRTGAATFFSYLKNRAVRILPAYYLFLLLYLHTGSWFFDFIDRGWTLHEGFELTLWTFTSNIFLAGGTWSGVALEGMFSLSIGVQMFILSGLLFAFIRSRRNIAVILILLEAVAIAARFVNMGAGTWSNYFFTITRMDSFLAGMLLSIALNNSKFKESLIVFKNKLLIISAILLLIIIGLTKGLSLWSVPATAWIQYPFIAFFMASVILRLVNSGTSPGAVLFVSKFGKFAFSIYLFKLPAVYFIYTILTRCSMGNTFLHLVLSFLIAEVFCFLIGIIWWTCVEKPCSILFLKLSR